MDDRHEEQEGEYGPLPSHGVGLGREVGLGSRCDADGEGNRTTRRHGVHGADALTIFTRWMGWWRERLA